MIETPNLLTIAQFSEKHRAFTVASLRWLRFNQETRGFARAFLTVGRRVLIDEGKFFYAIEQQNRSQESAAEKATSHA
jgi:hypothetical protein